MLGLGNRKNITYPPNGLAARPLCGSNATHFHPLTALKFFKVATATLKKFALSKKKITSSFWVPYLFSVPLFLSKK